VSVARFGVTVANMVLVVTHPALATEADAGESGRDDLTSRRCEAGKGRPIGGPRPHRRCHRRWARRHSALGLGPWERRGLHLGVPPSFLLLRRETT